MPEQTISDFDSVSLPPEVKGIFLDIDNTLYPYAPCHDAALCAVYNAYQYPDLAFEAFVQKYEEAKQFVKQRIPHHAASHSRLLYFQALLEKEKSERMIETALLMEDAYWTTFIKTMQPVRGLKEFLAGCRKTGQMIVVVTDLTASLQFKKLCVLGIDHDIDSIVTSEEAGVEKPAAAFFTYALKKAGLEPSQTVLIGDDLERDIKGAERVGVRAIRMVHA